MVTAKLTSGDGKRERRGAAPAVAISLVVHLVFFLAIGFMVPRPRLLSFEPSPPLRLILLPAPEEAHPTRSPAAKAPSPNAGHPPPPLVLPHLHVPQATASRAPPSPLAAPPASAGESGAPGTRAAPAPLPYEEGDRGVRAFLRATVGCDTPDAVHLTPEEKTRCSERFAATARGAPPVSAMDPVKRAGFAAQAAADDRKRAAREGPPTDVIVSCGGAGQARDFPSTGNTNLGGGCLPDAAIGHVRIP